MNFKIFLAGLLLGSVSTLQAQDKFSNTLTADSLTQSPTATLSDVAWVSGHWRGEAFGGTTEEFWTPPLGSSMMGAFKLVVDGQVQFYEMVTIAEENQSLILRLKHFHRDLKGWEKKDETVDFPLVKVMPDKVYFDGFTLERVSKNEMNIYVILQDKDDSREQKFTYHRVQ